MHIIAQKYSHFYPGFKNLTIYICARKDLALVKRKVLVYNIL